MNWHQNSNIDARLKFLKIKFCCNWKSKRLNWLLRIKKRLLLNYLLVLNIKTMLFHHWMMLQRTSIGKKQTKQERLSFLWSPSVSMWYLRSLMEIYWGHLKGSISTLTFFIIKKYIYYWCFIVKSCTYVSTYVHLIFSHFV